MSTVSTIRFEGSVEDLKMLIDSAKTWQFRKSEPEDMFHNSATYDSIEGPVLTVSRDRTNEKAIPQQDHADIQLGLASRIPGGSSYTISYVSSVDGARRTDRVVDLSHIGQR